MPESAIPLTVASSWRAGLQYRLQLVTDHTFADAPPAQLIVVVPGPPDKALEGFLRSRRSTARVILFLSDSELAHRLRGEGARGAMLLVGGPETIRTVVETGQAVAPTATASPVATMTPTPSASASPTPSAPPRPSFPRTAAPTPQRTPTRVEPARIFDRYFGAGATPTPEGSRER